MMKRCIALIILLGWLGMESSAQQRVEWYDHGRLDVNIVNLFSRSEGIAYSGKSDNYYAISYIDADGVDRVHRSYMFSDCHSEHRLANGNLIIDAGCLFDQDIYPFGFWRFNAGTEQWSYEYENSSTGETMEFTSIQGENGESYYFDSSGKLKSSEEVIDFYYIDYSEKSEKNVHQLFSAGAYRPFIKGERYIEKIFRESELDFYPYFTGHITEVEVDFDQHQIYALEHNQVTVLDTNLSVVKTYPLPTTRALEMQLDSEQIHVLGRDTSAALRIWAINLETSDIREVDIDLGTYPYIDFVADADTFYVSTDSLVHRHVTGQSLELRRPDLKLIDGEGSVLYFYEDGEFMKKYDYDITVQNVGDYPVDLFHIHSYVRVSKPLRFDYDMLTEIEQHIDPGETITANVSFTVPSGHNQFDIAIPGADYMLDANLNDNRFEINLDVISDVATTEASFYNYSPNPAQDNLYLDSDLSIDEISIYSLTGSRLAHYHRPGRQIDVSNIPSGIYLMQARSGGQVVIDKLIVQR